MGQRQRTLARLHYLNPRFISREELEKEGAKLRDLVASSEQDIGRLGDRVCELERQMREWKKHLN